MKRQTNYPAIGLERAVVLTGKIYSAVVDAAIDGETVLNLMGYGGVSGTSATSLAALKKFGLVEGRDQELRVTELAKRILQPMDDNEKFEALSEAASKPELYSEVKERFTGHSPSEEVLKSFLVRNYGFRPRRADVFIKAFRETEELLARTKSFHTPSITENLPSQISDDVVADVPIDMDTKIIPSNGANSDRRTSTKSVTASEVMTFRLSPEVRVELTFEGRVNQRSISKLIAFLELAKDGFSSDDDVEATDEELQVF